MADQTSEEAARALGLGDWTGTWEADNSDSWGSHLEFLGAFEGRGNSAAKPPEVHRYRVESHSFMLEHEVPADGFCAALREDLDGELHPAPYPAAAAEGPGGQLPVWRSSWVEQPLCFRTEIPELPGQHAGLSAVIERRLLSGSEFRINIRILDLSGSNAAGPFTTSFRKTSPAGPAPLAWLRARGKSLATAAERQEALECVWRMLNEGLDEISAAQLKDRIVPPRFDGTAKMLMGACKFYQSLVPNWMAPEKIQDTCPDALKNGVEADWFVINEPKGVGIAVVPWNAPMTLAVIPTLGMLAAGNRVAIKAPELTPTVAAVTRRLFHRHLYGYVWVEEGGKEAVERLIDEGADHLVFTGGGEIAKVVAARCARTLTPMTLELGGKSPAFVDASLSGHMLDSVVSEILETKWAKTGQYCCAHDYALVHADVHEAFCAKLKAAVEALGLRRNIALIDRRHYEAVKAKLEEADVECIPPLEGRYVPDDQAMTLPLCGLLSPSHDKRVMTTEIFGPLLPILKVRDVEEAISIVNGNKVGKPLIAYCYSDDQASVDAFLARTSSGNVAINAGPHRFTLNFNCGFGGIGPSGTGCAMWGREALREFSNRKHVLHAKGGFARSFFSGPPAPPS